MEKLLAAGLQLDISKSEFFVHEIKYLGMIVGEHGIRMDPEKVQAVQEWKTPRSVKEVQAILGFANFYRRFIEKFGRIASPLTALTKKAEGKYIPFDWTEDCERAFTELKAALIRAPVLALFYPDRKTTLETDASDYVTAAVLSQKGENGV